MELTRTTSGKSAIRPRRRWGRKGQVAEIEGAAYVAAAAMARPAYDRFARSILSPVQTGSEGRFRSWAQAGARLAARPVARPRRRLALRPLRFLDRVLLLIEVIGALVVAWLVWQYVYTVYFDTAPRRPVAQVAGRVATPTAASAASPTATHFAEVAPPMVIGTPEEAPLVSGGTEVAPTITPVPPTATATIEPRLLLPTRVRIPVMFLDSPVEEVMVDMGEWQVSPMLVGHHEGSASPGETGNMVLAAHRDINSALFRELDRLKPGDDVFVSNSLREYRYIVQESFVVQPNQVEVLAPTDDKRVTLITCTPIGLATQRLVVVATLDESY